MAVCFAKQNPTFQPARRIISAISSAVVPTVTTTTNHDYITGEIVRFIIPEGYGMTALNEKLATITVTGNTTFTFNIDTTNFDPFITPTEFPLNRQCAQIIPVGEVNSTFAAATKNVLPTGNR